MRWALGLRSSSHRDSDDRRFELRSLAAMGAAMLTLAGCVIAPFDPLPAAQRALDNGDLLRAMAFLDQVPAAHPFYPRARALMATVESRVADSQRCIAEGLQLRAQGDQSGAEQAFARARDCWPLVCLASELSSGPAVRVAVAPGIAATVAPLPQAASPSEETPRAVATEASPSTHLDDEGRSTSSVHDARVAAQSLLEPPPLPVALVEVRSATTVTTAVDRRQPVSELAGAETPAISTQGDTTSPLAPAPNPTTSEDSTGVGAVRLDLTSLRALVQGRDQNRAATELARAHAAHPENQEIRDLLAMILKKRALVAYGRGWLDAAVEDWQQVVALTPDDRSTQTHLAVARAELARRESSDAKRKNAGG